MDERSLPKNILSPHARSLLDALQCQGEANNCGPFSVTTVINALKNLHLEGVVLAQEMNRPVWRGILYVVRRIPDSATFPWGMVDMLRRYGLGARWRLLGNEQRLLQGLEEGRVLLPIIGSWKPLAAHVMALVAWDQEQGWGFANTQYDHHDIHWVPDEEFRKKWKAMGKLVIEVFNG